MSTTASCLKSIADSLVVIPAEQMRTKLYTVVNILASVPDYYEKEVLEGAFMLTKEGAK